MEINYNVTRFLYPRPLRERVGPEGAGVRGV